MEIKKSCSENNFYLQQISGGTLLITNKLIITYFINHQVIFYTCSGMTDTRKAKGNP